MKHTYPLTGLHCGSCVQKITAALKAVDGVRDAEVTLDPMRAVVTMDRHVATDRLAEAVSDAGSYELHEPEPDAVEPTEAVEPADPADAAGGTDNPPESLYPLLLIVGYILGVVVLTEAFSAAPSWMQGMRHFMAGFFLVFSFFKLLDVPGFVSAYRGYDLLARRSSAWAHAYPFVELALGVAYLLALFPVAVNAVALILMLIGAAGVLKAITDKRAIRCACLGTALNLPMTTVTLVEDLTMAAMAAVMLALLLF